MNRNDRNLNTNQSILNSESNYKYDKFLPYRDSGSKHSNNNEPQNPKRILTASNTNKENKNDRSPLKSEDIRAKSNKTPRYNGKNVRLVKSKNQIVEQHKRSVHYNNRSRQKKLSGLRSNIKTRSSHNQKLTTNTNVCKYTQDAIQNYSLTDKSRSRSKESANISISTICKGLEGKNNYSKFDNYFGFFILYQSFLICTKINKIIRIITERINDHNRDDESFEIYSKQNKIKMKLPGRKKYYMSKFSSKICPITIIQAPITVNGQSSVNVHQSIVLSNKRGNINAISKIPETAKVSSEGKEIDISL